MTSLRRSRVAVIATASAIAAAAVLGGQSFAASATESDTSIGVTVSSSHSSSTASIRFVRFDRIGDSDQYHLILRATGVGTLTVVIDGGSARARTATAQARGYTQTWPLDSPGAPDEYDLVVTLPAGAHTVEMTATDNVNVTSATQTVTYTTTDPVPPAPTPTPAPDDHALAHTGADPLGGVGAALAAVLLGAVIWRRRRLRGGATDPPTERRVG